MLMLLLGVALVQRILEIVRVEALQVAFVVVPGMQLLAQAQGQCVQAFQIVVVNIKVACLTLLLLLLLATLRAEMMWMWVWVLLVCVLLLLLLL